VKQVKHLFTRMTFRSAILVISKVISKPSTHRVHQIARSMFQGAPGTQMRTIAHRWKLPRSLAASTAASLACALAASAATVAASAASAAAASAAAAASTSAAACAAYQPAMVVSSAARRSPS
jgi:hypothetical protein